MIKSCAVMVITLAVSIAMRPGWRSSVRSGTTGRCFVLASDLAPGRSKPAVTIDTQAMIRPMVKSLSVGGTVAAPPAQAMI